MDIPKTADTLMTPRTAAYASLHGLRMYYELHGAKGGRPLVLIHGGGSTIQTSFGRLLPWLHERPVIAVEQQGHGHTADIERAFSLEQMADDTAALLQHLQVPDADILGYSTGGVIALHLALRHPKLLHRLILASSFYKRQGCYQAMWDGFPRATLDVMPAVLRDAFLKVAPRPADLEVQFRKTVTMLMGFQDLDEDALRTITARTLILTGDQDVVRPEHGVEMFRLFSEGQLAVFPNAPHGAYLGAAEAMDASTVSRAPEFMARLIQDFLDQP